ncbi:hypothetical protein B0J11DRAFT_311463 [Dendryphion nanum]|uniref:Uncharacterized protein n=1 Tax=Dendryphion nanum TaxID=256645 RepID=A0A9P9IM85_9PLEO|nr:hypothetical protein B0J11DRAFT_311463 [Dendryphion nanum]
MYFRNLPLLVLVVVNIIVACDRTPAVPHRSTIQARPFFALKRQTTCPKGYYSCTSSNGKTICAGRDSICCEWALDRDVTPFTCPTTHSQCCPPDVADPKQMKCGSQEKKQCLGGGIVSDLELRKKSWSLRRLRRN